MNRTIGQRWSAGARGILTPVAALLCAVNLGAQTTTASLRGYVRVYRQAGKTVPGAKVTATNVATGYVHQSVAKADGSFSLTLDPAVYNLEVAAPGFVRAKQTIRVQIGQSLNLDLNIAPESQASAVVEVTGTQELVELKSSEVATNITTEQLEFLPQGRRSFIDFAALAPGVRLSTDPNSQSFSSGGQNNQKVNIFIDGVSYKNDVIQGGVMGQDSSKGNPFPIGAVQEFRVMTENFKAEYQKASAGIITAVTKSGGNEIHGDVFSYYQNKNLVAQDKWDAKQGLPKATYERWQQGFSVGGPIIKDKVHFFLSYEHHTEDRENNVYFGYQKDNTTTPVPAALLSSLQYTVGTFTSPFRSDLLFGKINWQIDPNQGLELVVNYRNETDKRGFGGQTSYERGENMKIGVSDLTLKHTVTSANWINEAMVSSQRFRWNPTGISADGVGYNYDGLMTVGGYGGGQDIVQKRLAFRDDFTYVGALGHRIKAGANVDFLNYEVSKYFDFNPTFFFYLGNDPNSGNTPTFDVPAFTNLRVGNPTVKTSNRQIGLYIQDDWNVNPRLTLNLGVRWDYESDMFNNDYVTPANLVSSLGNLVPSNYITDGSKRKPFYGAFQPRLGFSYDLTGNNRTVVFGGVGRYYDREAFNNSLDEKFRQQSHLYTFVFSTEGQPRPWGELTTKWDPSYLSREGLLGLLAQGRAGSEQAFFLNNDQKQPYSDQMTIGIKHSTGTVNYSLTYTNVQSHDQLTWIWGDKDANGAQIPLPTGISNILLSSTFRTWYQAAYLVIDRPYTESAGWGAGVTYTYSTTEKTGTDLFSLSTPYYDPNVRHHATGEERHRVVANGIVKIPWGFRLSALLTLGSGPLYDITDISNGWGHDVIHSGAGKPIRYTFIIPSAWAYRSLDLKLQKDFILGKTRLGVMVEGLNIMNYANWTYGWDSGAIKPNGEVNPLFGQPTGVIGQNSRRMQVGVTYTF